MTSRPSGWAIGWTTFAGVMMIMAGIWWITGRREDVRRAEHPDVKGDER